MCTMIIDNKAELNQWQAVAAQNAVYAGLCVEQQLGLVYTGYFILGDDIAYNGTWTPYKTYGQLWTLLYNNQGIYKNAEDFKAGATAAEGQLIEGAFQEDWGKGIKAGFKGVFDGDGHYIDGLCTTGEYSSFIVTMGGGTIKNVAFINAGIGSMASLVADRGYGAFENIYVQVKYMESGTASGGDTVTMVVMRNHNPVTYAGMTNVLVDFTAIFLIPPLGFSIK